MGFIINNAVLKKYIPEAGVIEVTVPDNVIEIGSSAFKGCTVLKSITLPARLTEIGSFAFKDCTSLESITLPDRLTESAWLAFLGCTSLKNIILTPSAIRACSHKYLQTSLKSV